MNNIAAHFDRAHGQSTEGWEGDMVLEKGDPADRLRCAHPGHIGDNALTFEVGNTNNHTEQIKAAREARDAAIEMMHPGTPWHKVGEAAAQPSLTLASNPFGTCAATSSSLGCSMLACRCRPTAADQTTRGSKVSLRKVPCTPWNRSTPPVSRA